MQKNYGRWPLNFSLICIGQTQQCRGWPYSGLLPQMEDWGLNMLKAPYTENEIHATLMKMNPLKAPSPNGIQALFYQKAWEVVGPSVSLYVKGVLEGMEHV